MPDYTITLNASQEDAIQSLTQLARVEQDNEDLTAGEVLQTFVAQVLYSTEVAIEETMQTLLAAGNQLPNVVRDRMTDTLSAEQLALIVHLQPPVGDAAQG